MKKEDINVGTFFLAPKDFFTVNSTNRVRERIERDAYVREDGRVLCMVIEDVRSVLPHKSEYQVGIRPKEDYLPIIGIRVNKDCDFECWEKISNEESNVQGLLWGLYML